MIESFKSFARENHAPCIDTYLNYVRYQLFGCDSVVWGLKLRSILATHAFDLVGMKRSWHSTEGGSVTVGVERVSVINRYPACIKRKWRGMKVGKEKCNMKDD